MSKQSIRPGIYKHYKGNEYQVFDTATHSETEETLVVYKTLYGNYDLWVRPYEMFTETVNVNGKNVARFEWVREAEKPASLE